jgi:hypothetical protein
LHAHKIAESLGFGSSPIEGDIDWIAYIMESDPTTTPKMEDAMNHQSGGGGGVHMDVDTGTKEKRKKGGGTRGQRTKAQKKKKKKMMEKALSIADRMETKVAKLSSKKTKKMSGKSLWGK